MELPSTRKEALEKGIKLYLPIKPCKRGHTSPKHVSGSCLECKQLYDENYRKNNKEKIKEWHKKHHKETYSTEKRRQKYDENIENEILSHARNRAKEKNLEFNITKEDIEIPEYCPVFGIKLSRKNRLTAPSLDRIDNTKGYIKGNVMVISSKANRLKNNGSLEEFEKIILYIKSNIK